MQMTGYVGAPGTKTVDGSQPLLRQGNQTDLIVSENHGRYYEATYRGKMFYSHVTARTLTASNTTYTGHAVWNSSSPASGVNLVIHKVALVVSVTSASMTGIALGYSSGQTAAPTGTTASDAAGSLFMSSGVGAGLSYRAATLAVAGVNIIPLIHNTAAINTVGVDSNVFDMEGSIIIPPGYVVQLLALGAASAASALTSTIFWEEVPV